MSTAKNVKAVNGFHQTIKPRAYSYVRFSTPEQAEGDSLRRQAEQAAKYASARGWELDTSLKFQDLGVSGYRGANAEKGALSAFLQAVEDGTVAKGSYLIVESLDRISRQVPRKAARTLEAIVEAGVNLVDLEDGGRIYNTDTLDSDGMAFLMMVIRFIRANQESAMKSVRVTAAYDRKRQRAEAGDKSKPFTRRLPAWLAWDDGSNQFKVIEGRGEIVRAIFTKAIEGWGLSKIARWLNDQRTPTWGDAQEWDKSYVKKILTSPAVIGTFTPHHRHPDKTGKRRRKPIGTTIENYFPAVVEREMFDTVALRFATTTTRGRHANREVRSLFAGVIRCARCGSTVSRVAKGEHVYLACAKAHSIGTHPFRTVRYPFIEKLFRQRAKGIIKDAPRTSDTDLEEQIRQRGVSVDALEVLVRELVEEWVEHKSHAIRQRCNEAEAELAKARDELRALIARRDALEPKSVERRLRALSAALQHKPFDVAAANAAMRLAIRKIEMDAERGELRIWWHHVAEDADPQVVTFPTFTRVPGGWHVPTKPQRTKSTKATTASPR